MSMVALPPIDDAIDLSTDLVDAYRRDGHVCVRGLLSPDEVRAYREVILDATMRHNRETRPLHERDTYGRAFLQVMNLWTVDEQVKRFTLAKRFAKVAADLMGVPSVRIYHDQALFKEPGGGHTPWHQDGYYWPIEQSQTVTLWMPLVNVPAEMGTMTFASRSHLDPIIEFDTAISDASEAFFAEEVQRRGYDLVTYGAMTAGDATFHSGVTLHRAPGNALDFTREVMTVIYVADALTVKQPANENQVNDLASWFPGLKPGDPAASPLNPIAYP